MATLHRLHKKEEQLREKEHQLREEKLIFLRREGAALYRKILFADFFTYFQVYM